MTIIQYFRKVQSLPIRESYKVLNLKLISDIIIHDVQIEQCFYIDIGEHKNLSSEELKKLEWLLIDPLDCKGLSQNTFLNKKDNDILIEIGPRYYNPNSIKFPII